MRKLVENLIWNKMIVKSLLWSNCESQFLHLKFNFILILAREREALVSWFFVSTYLFDLYL